MARPKKRQEERFNKQLPSVRCSDKEFTLITSNCEKAGLSLSAYIRKCAQGQKIVVKKSKWDVNLYKEVRRIGININQQTRKLHQQGSVPPELERLWQRLNRLLEEIMQDNDT